MHRTYVGAISREDEAAFWRDYRVVGPLLQTVNFVTIALLPDRIREEYGFSPVPPALVRKALVEVGAQYVRRAVVPLLPGRLRYAA